MKLKNKKTGDIAEPFGITCVNGKTFVQFDDGKGIFKFEAHSLAELNAEWEDYEEPKGFYYIRCNGDVELDQGDMNSEHGAGHKQIGNYFETKEEAEKAVERLKKLQILRNKGYKIDVYFDHIIKAGENE